MPQFQLSAHHFARLHIIIFIIHSQSCSSRKLFLLPQMTVSVEVERVLQFLLDDYLSLRLSLLKSRCSLLLRQSRQVDGQLDNCSRLMIADVYSRTVGEHQYSRI